MEARSLLDEKITVHPATQDPTDVWTTMKKKQKILKLKVKQPTKPVGPDKVRFVCMADTHSLTHRITFRIPDGDVFLHAGDFTRSGTRREVLEFNEWLGMLPHRRKIVIAGNHELSFDDSRAAKADGSSGLNGKPRPISASRSAHTGVVIVNPVDEEEDSAPIGSGIPRPSSATVPSASAFGANMLKNFANSLGEIEEKLAAARKPNPKSLITNALYLQDGLATVHGINIYGTPWQPDFCGWAFNLPRGQALLDKWSKIPEGIDILLSHTPPLGHGDYTITGVRAGCVELLSSVQKRIRPKYHVFGHIHEGYGITSDGNTIFINASTCNTSYQPHNLPIVFDIPLPRGHTKDE